MSDNIPFEIQLEIIKKVYDVKSLIQFRSVSKPWKAFIDSSEFINGYGARHTQPGSHILSYRSRGELNCICLVDNDIETLKVQEQEFAPFVVSPLLKQCRRLYVLGACHGLLCLSGFKQDNTPILVIWNPSIGKSFGISLAIDHPLSAWTCYGFGVCPVTSDPMIVKLTKYVNMPWHGEVFRLSLGVWNVIPSGKLPPQSVTVITSTQVVIDKFIYWCADYGDSVVSFDLITEEFKVIPLQDTLTNKWFIRASISKLMGSLVICGKIEDEEDFGVWVMDDDSSFRKLFTIGSPVGHKIFDQTDEILMFKKNGEIIFRTRAAPNISIWVLEVYDPCSQRIKNLGISGRHIGFFMGSYKKSLLLLDHLDSHIYFDNN